MILVQQVKASLIVNFKVADTDLESGCIVFLDLAEYIAQCARNNTSISVSFGATSNCKSLTRASLTIRENCSIITFKASVNYIFCDVVKDLLLFGKHVENTIVDEVVVIITNFVVAQAISLEVELNLTTLICKT